MKEMLNKAKFMVAHGLVKKVSENCWEVDNHIVKRIVKPGRSILSCDCPVSSRFCVEHPICQHQTAILFFESQSNFNQHIDKLIKTFESFKKNNLQPSLDAYIEELKILRGKK